MSHEHDLASMPVGPPWTLDVIADLQAGLFPAEVEAELRTRIAQDPQANSMLQALNSVVDDLSLLPPLRMPDRYASRLDAAIAQESAARSVPTQRSAPPDQYSGVSTLRNGPAEQSGGSGRPRLAAVPSRAPGGAGQAPGGPGQPPAGPPRGDVTAFAAGPPAPPPAPPQAAPGFTAPGRPGGPGETGNVRSLDAARRRRRNIIGGLGIAAAAAAIAVISINGFGQRDSAGEASVGTPVLTASPSSTLGSPGVGAGAGGSAFEIDPNNLQGAFAKVNGQSNGPLTNPLTFASCMAANDITGSQLLGVSSVTYQGAPASAIAIAIDPTHARLLVVGPECGPQGAQLLASQTVTR